MFKRFGISTFMLVCTVYVNAQTWDKSNGCMTDSIKNPEAVFTRTEISAAFRGNMTRFLTNNIDVNALLHSMSLTDSSLSDTARIKFIMSKNGEISNVSVSKVKNPVFTNEALRLFRLSSCSWEIGIQGGRHINSWAQFDILLRLTRKNGEIKVSLGYKQYDPPEMPM